MDSQKELSIEDLYETIKEADSKMDFIERRKMALKISKGIDECLRNTIRKYKKQKEDKVCAITKGVEE